MHEEPDRMNTVLNWSSGKDAALAFHYLRQQDRYRVTHLLTTCSEATDRVVMHGVRKSLLEAQVQAMDLPLTIVELPAAPDNQSYAAAMNRSLSDLKKQGVQAAAFGDIFLEDLKKYRLKQLQPTGLEILFPLWEKDTRKLIAEVEDSGIEAVIVCVDERKLPLSFLGRKINRGLLNDLPEGVDPCGENGEYHSFVTHAPFFNHGLSVARGEVVYRRYREEDESGFYFLNLHLI